MFEERAVSGKRGKSRAGSYWRSGEICPPYGKVALAVRRNVQ